MTPRSLSASLLVASLVATGVASGAGREPAPAELALARRLFADARAAEKAHDWPAAIAKLREALVVKETAGLRFHLAFAEEQSGLLVEALADYDRARDALARAPADDVAPKLEARRAALRGRVPTLSVRIPDAPAGTTLLVDGAPIDAARLGTPVPQNPGAHHLVATAPGREPVSRDLRLAEGERAETVLVFPALASAAGAASGPAAAPASPEPAPAAPDRGASRAGSLRPWVLGGEAVLLAAGLGAGVGFTLAARGADGRADDARAQVGPSPSACAGGGAALGLEGPCADLRSATDDASRARTLATIGFVGAGVSAAALVATAWLWPSASARPAASVSAAGWTLGASGRF